MTATHSRAPKPVIRPPKLAADHIRELVKPFTSSEQIRRPQRTSEGWVTRTTVHSVTHPALLDQLETAISGSPLTDEDLARPGYGPKPSASVNAIDVRERIARESAEYATKLDLPVKPLRERLLAISGKVGGRLDHTVERWWVAARIATGWDSPAFAPTVPCPVESCEALGTLRIRLVDRVGSCMECHTVWSVDQFGGLALWVAWASEHLTGRAHLIDGEPCPECVGARLAIASRRAEREANAKGRSRATRPTSVAG